jgi:hypothetical protein
LTFQRNAQPASLRRFPYMENTPSAIEDVKSNLNNYVSNGEEYVRANPTKSVLIGLGGGFLLAQLPFRFMTLALVKLLLLLVKPATFVYAISKLFDDVRSSNGRMSADSP